MTRQNRFKYQMFVRVRDFGADRKEVFPEASGAGGAFRRVAAVVAAIDEHQKDHIVARTKVREVKASTREVVYEQMKAIALAGRRVTEEEPGANPFRMPKRRRIATEIATARAFIEEAEKRHDTFVRFGLPATFVADFRVLVDGLQQLADVRLNSKTVRRQAMAGIEAELAQGMDAVRDLEALVAFATRQDPATFAAWTTARRIRGAAAEGRRGEARAGRGGDTAGAAGA